MKITDTQAYISLIENFYEKGYSRGTKDTTPIYYWDGNHQNPNLT